MKTKKQNPITTKIELAKAVGISRPSLDKYLSQPGAPTRTIDGWSLEAVVDFIADSATREATAASASPRLRDLRAKEIGLRCERLRFRLDQERRLYVKRSDVSNAISRIVSECKNVLTVKLEQEYPAAVAGLEVVQARVYSKRLLDDIVTRLGALGTFLDL